MESGSSVGGTSSVDSIQGKPFPPIRLENPFTFKVGQVFTGFGVGCGVGIGVGRPLNLGAIPVLNQVMSATRGATDAFSGVGRHVNSSLRKLGAKNIEAGIGCGVGFGHGFGVGLAVKPGVLHQIQSSLTLGMTKMMMKFGIVPSLPFGQGALPTSLQSGIGINSPLNQTSAGNMMQKASQSLTGSQPMQIGSPSENVTSKDNSFDPSFGNRTEKVLNNFLQNPLLKGEQGVQDGVAGRLREENNILKMVLKHQQIIEDLVEENEKLRQILMEDLKIPSSKLKPSWSVQNIQSSSSARNKSPCANCFECRRKQRKK